MTGEPITSFVATLLYRETMAEGFRQIVAEFDEAFRNRPQLPYTFGRPYDDFAVFDIDGAHIVIAHGDTAGPGASRGPGDRAVVALAISAEVGAEPALVPRFQRLLRSIVARIQRPFPAEAVLWTTHRGDFAPDIFDELLNEAASEAVAAMVGTPAPEPDEEPVAAAAATVEPAAPPRPQHPEAHPEGARHMKRPRNRFSPVDEVVCGLNEPGADFEHAAAPPDAVANALPDIPAPMLTEAARIRLALYPPEPEILPPERAPTPQRVAIYTLNTALILVAMPVGVAVLTYNVLGRESMTATARSTALAGFGIAMSYTTGFGQALLAMI